MLKIMDMCIKNSLKPILITLCVITLLSSAPTVFAQSEEVETEKPIRVSTRLLSELVFFPKFSAPAKVISLNNSQISSLINAQIESINVLVGDAVQKGQTLVTLDCTDANLTQASALAQLQFAKKESSRLEKLKIASAVTEQSLNSAQTDVSLARIAYKQAKLQVTRCNVPAPFAGVVVSRLSSEGELASPGTPLISLVDLNRLEVTAELHTGDSQLLASAKAMNFSWSGNRYPLSIRYFSKVIDSVTRNREIRLLFLKQKALVGAAGRLVWQGITEHIASDMLSEREGHVGIFIAEKNRARFVVLPEATAGHTAEIMLPLNTRVIVDGRFGLHDGVEIAHRGL